MEREEEGGEKEGGGIEREREREREGGWTRRKELGRK